VNWYRRHLNWTLGLVFVICLIGVLLAASIGGTADFIVRILATLISFLVAGWVINQKRRRLLWLFMGFIPFGFIVFFTLDNRSELWDMRHGVLTKVKANEDDKK